MTGEGRLGLKSGRGFYEYDEGAAEAVKRKRDSRLLARLEIFRKENQGENHG